MSFPKRVLIAVTDYSGVLYDDGSKTGLFLSEAYDPFKVFSGAGFDIQFISENGKFGYDPHSLESKFASEECLAAHKNPKSPYSLVVDGILPAAEIIAANYSIFFACGGHGALFDFVDAPHLGKVAADIYANGGIVSAVCHGPAIFNSIKDAEGVPIVKDKTITGFAPKGEVEMGVVGALKKHHLKLVPEIAEDNGATYMAPPTPFEDFTITDERILTGANPQSSITLSDNIVQLWNAIDAPTQSGASVLK
ncbi:Glutathione-independent glyoxalase HSP31 [Yarrowia sp. B02]|nr:Glutathione-independent glyoxalase HSP31 [Yarrowia sp. B02]